LEIAHLGKYYVQILDVDPSHYYCMLSSFSEWKTLQKKDISCTPINKNTFLISAEYQLKVVMQPFWHINCKYLAVNSSIIFLDVKGVTRGKKIILGLRHPVSISETKEDLWLLLDESS